MKKLGLCVRYDCNNYGSMLQIYATQLIIKRMGWDYEIIRYNKFTVGFILRNMGRIFNPYFMKGKILGYRKQKAFDAHPDIKKLNEERIKQFAAYRREYIGPYSKEIKGYENLVKSTGNYDAIMVGSDQLWTPAGVKSKFYNLMFVPDGIKKISFATSFGIDEVPKNQVLMTKKYLNRIEYISVRETSGAKIVRELTGKDATVALDPTLLLTGAEWEDFFPTNKVVSTPYIFAYFLGTDTSHREVVNKLAKKTGLKIITCPFMDEFVDYDISFGDEHIFSVSPIDFLNLIRCAEYICTDSFHGTVFSILNHKKFITFDRYSDELRKSKNGRISNLLNSLGLMDRQFDSCDLCGKISRDINYEKVESRLAQLREETFSFLEMSLS